MADYVAPVRNIIKAFETGIKLANKVSRSASDASAAQALQISESAQSLQRSLERSSQIISDSYQQYVGSCGKPFGKALEDDDDLKQRFKNLRTDVRDRIDECDEFEEDPESFRAAAFSSIEREAQDCADQCITIFHNVRERVGLVAPRSLAVGSPPRDDRTQLASMRQRAPSMRKPVPSPSQSTSSQNSLPTPAASPPERRLYLDISPAEPVKPKSPWTIDSPSQFDLGAHMSPPSRSQRRTSREASPGSTTDAEGRLIPREVVLSRVRANEEFLQRRRDSRLMFQNEFRKSISSIDEHRVSEIFTTSPILTPISPTGATGGMSISPIDGRASRTSMSDYQTLMTRQRSQGGASQGTRSSIASSEFQERPATRRHDSEADSIFGLRAAGPLSPPLSEHRSSAGLEGIPVAATLRLPDFGEGVYQGIEVVDNTDYTAGLIPVHDNEPPPVQLTSSAPATSVRSIDHPMRHDASFFKFGGFCDGAKALVRGETGFKIYKRPAGHYSATVSARCIKCSYEVGWNDVEKDRLLDRGGIYGNCGVRFRQRFISKCHVKTKSIEESCYACIFCIQEHKTVEEHDATIFFSVSQLFRHLATHTRPLPEVSGIITLYGLQPPEAVDFDIHFPLNEPSLHVFNIREIAQKVATRPSATAVVTHHPKRGHSGATDPDGHPAMHFAVGAKIVGVTFPTQFGGQWCMGYHDGERGSFPASAITLDLPAREDLLMNQASPLVATAKWDFKPKEAKDSTRGWLKFNKGDLITNIGYTFQDQWCWSGYTNRGKAWGLFPQAFVENLGEGGQISSSPSVRHKFGFGKMPTLQLARSPTNNVPSHERRTSVRSTNSNGSGNMVQLQPGLEVVQSPIYGSSSTGWRR
ncbi:uncharacterized protein PAC_14073 [Phialocephala subalpina]|uniref:SH3 domain-containing protein n=1 Tax=Phialocephala subalpina TaxID=576137 RepID=A0A1L7XGT2_9HELO|nr:uncharacterized protein PAC_14073 [Phialocephala subalpina]